MLFVKYSYRVGYIELQSWHLTLGNSINSDSTNSKNGDHPPLPEWLRGMERFKTTKVVLRHYQRQTSRSHQGLLFDFLLKIYLRKSGRLAERGTEGIF